MKEDFKRSMAPLLKHEGGRADHPADPGGRTYKGITQATYNAWRKKLHRVPADVWKATDEEVLAIYKAGYWDKVHGDELPDGIDYCVFDAATNSGPVQSVKWLQRALGVTPDGDLGAITLAAVQTVDDKDEEARVIDSMCDQRLAFMRSLRTWKTFGGGWTVRVRDVRGISKAWVDSVDTIAFVSYDAGTAKAVAADTKVSETPAGSAAIKQASLGSGGALAWIGSHWEKASDMVATFSGLSPDTAQIVLGVAAVGALGALAFFGFWGIMNVLSRRKSREPMEAF